MTTPNHTTPPDSVKTSKRVRIFRSGTDIPYFIHSSNAAQDKNLSWEARGVHAYLLSKPADWIVQPTDLQQNCGRQKVYKVLKELEDAGYIKRQVIREKGILRGVDYTVSAIPIKDAIVEPSSPCDEKPDTVLPDTVKHHITNYRDIQSIDSTKEEIPGIPPDALKKKDEEIASLRAQIDDLTAKVAMLMQSNAAAMTPSKTELSLVKANPPAPRPPRPVDPLIDAIAYGSFGLTGKLNGQVTRITGIVYGCKTAPVGLLQMAFQTKDMSTISQDRLNELIGNVKAAYSWHSKKLKDGKPLSPPNTALTIWSTIQNYLKEEEAAAPSSNIDERGMDLDYWEYNPETKLYQRRG